MQYILRIWRRNARNYTIFNFGMVFAMRHAPALLAVLKEAD
jgi:hypothetical protein